MLSILIIFPYLKDTLIYRMFLFLFQISLVLIFTGECIEFNSYTVTQSFINMFPPIVGLKPFLKLDLLLQTDSVQTFPSIILSTEIQILLVKLSYSLKYL